MRIVVYSSWFRPCRSRDTAEELILGLERRGITIAQVIVHHGDTGFAKLCRRRRWPFTPTLPEFSWPSARWSKALADDPACRARLSSWLEPLRLLNPDLGLTFYATWVPDAMAAIPRLGFYNFHPAPLPQLRHYFPEDLAILQGRSRLGGTMHRLEPAMDEGAIVARTRAVRIDRWDTPDSLSQKVAEAALPDIWRCIERLLLAKVRLIRQNPRAVFEASYAALYAESVVNWQRDSHLVLHRRFQVFRGQAHRMLLKADWQQRRWVIWEWELHRGRYRGRCGELIHSQSDCQVIRSREGICIVWRAEVYLKEPGSGRYVDQKRMHPEQVIAPGRRYPMASMALLRSLRVRA